MQGSLEPQDNAAGAAHQQLLQDGASLHASLEAVAQQIRSIAGLPTAVMPTHVDVMTEDLQVWLIVISTDTRPLELYISEPHIQWETPWLDAMHIILMAMHPV